MRIDLGRFIKRKEDYDSENIISPIKDYNRDKYLNRRVFIRILFTLIYGYGFGYILAIEATTIQEIKITIINFIVFYILSFYLIQIPHEFIHTLFYKKPFKNSGITNAAGWIETDQEMKTKIPGVFAIGDAREKDLRQITTAVGEGGIAGQQVYKYIEAQN